MSTAPRLPKGSPGEGDHEFFPPRGSHSGCVQVSQHGLDSLIPWHLQFGGALCRPTARNKLLEEAGCSILYSFAGGAQMILCHCFCSTCV